MTKTLIGIILIKKSQRNPSVRKKERIGTNYHNRIPVRLLFKAYKKQKSIILNLMIQLFLSVFESDSFFGFNSSTSSRSFSSSHIWLIHIYIYPALLVRLL